MTAPAELKTQKVKKQEIPKKELIYEIWDGKPAGYKEALKKNRNANVK
jgi:hypothetical protein